MGPHQIDSLLNAVAAVCSEIEGLEVAVEPVGESESAPAYHYLITFGGRSSAPPHPLPILALPSALAGDIWAALGRPEEWKSMKLLLEKVERCPLTPS